MASGQRSDEAEGPPVGAPPGLEALPLASLILAERFWLNVTVTYASFKDRICPASILPSFFKGMTSGP